MKNKWSLDNNSINSLLAEMLTELEKAGVPKDDCLRFRISLEEILLDYQNVFLENAALTVSLKKRSDIFYVRITLEGDEFNPLKETDSLVLIKTIHKWNSAPSFQYKNTKKGIGRNILTYAFKIRGSLRENLIFTWKYTGQSKGYLTLAVVLQLVSVVFLIIAPVLSAKIIVHLTDKAVYQVLWTALILFVVNLANAAIMSGCNWAYNVVYNKTLTLLEVEISKNVLRIENRAVEENGTGLFIQRLTVDTSNLATAFNTLADNISQICQYVGILAAMFIVSLPVFLAVVILLSLQIVTELKRQKVSHENGRIYRNFAERYTGIVGEMVRGGKDIKLVNAQQQFESDLQESITNANDSRMKWDAGNRKYKLFISLVRESGALLFVALLGCLLSDGKLDVATALVLFNYYTSLGTPAITLLGTILDFVTQFNLSSERLQDITDNNVFPKESFGNIHKENLKGEIEFRNVRFSYNIGKLKTSTRWVLNDLSFKILPGETVALVGRSGSGKTTIMNLISRLYDPFSGMITIDGTNIKDLDRDSLRGSMSVVTQSPYIFQMSIRENLRIVKPDMTEDEMKRAAKLACIDEEIESKPEKYDTVVGEGGISLSGGQRQRLAIARALLRETKILLLDEATSALDNVTQDRIRESLDRIKGQCTVMIIAHRLSTIVNADRILYLKDGQIIAEGKHSELMAGCAEYRELYEKEEKQS
ncbi:ATP-binding cassette, subfamily B [Oribacterium sp. KHPX15]|uniref:ABC transporter ATP-binding protein n=1 Tax=Oribacterium sp. KHPX15 TaxID=1855342 RepID=UPI00089B2402|nr:ABC transporter ATP-binding protein [Oribacterium sp. KHPX15]SEA65416.1 ATP-binding cassette, subfamily B [Oribacterium sp. KHPX15]